MASNDKYGFISRRRARIQQDLPLDRGLGLEISPNFAPLIDPEEAQMHYCDILSYEQLQEREKNNASMIENNLTIIPLTFVHDVGKTLQECAPAGIKYDFIVSSHVMEHVPDFLGYLYQQHALLNDDGLICFVLPNFKGSGEFFRPYTNVADLLNAYLLGMTKPSPGMVYESHSNGFHWENVPLNSKTIKDVNRYFEPHVWFNDALRSVTEYIDVHCWTFTPESFVRLADELRLGGYFNFDIVHLSELDITATGHCNEFYVKLRPNAPAGAEPQRPIKARKGDS